MYNWRLSYVDRVLIIFGDILTLLSLPVIDMGGGVGFDIDSRSSEEYGGVMSYNGSKSLTESLSELVPSPLYLEGKPETILP